uniref:Uncharacterized protein n=1 Tax=Romanomermis culicivorax TaxID=13658 RepID=A0A915HI66_ROMCU
MTYYGTQNGNAVFDQDTAMEDYSAKLPRFKNYSHVKKNSFKLRTMVRKSTITGQKSRINNGVAVTGRPASIFVETGRRFSSGVVAAWNNASKTLARKSLASEESHTPEHGGIALQPSSITRQLAFGSLEYEDDSPLRVAFGAKHAFISRYLCNGLFLAKFCAIFLIGVYLLSVYFVKTSEKALDRRLAGMYANGSLVSRYGMSKKNG